MKGLRRTGLACVLMALGAISAWAGAGESGVQVLQQDLGARPAAMAGAYTALAGDIFSIGFNPAGLADLKKTELTFMHWGGIEGMATEWLAGAVPVPGLGTLGAQVLYLGQPSINNQVPGEGAVEVKDLLFGVSFSTSIMQRLKFGANAKIVLMTLGPADASAVALDLGSQYALDDSTRLGVAARNLGPGVTFVSVEDPLPMTLSAGVSRILVSGEPYVLTADLDVNYQVPEENVIVRLGGEYWFRKTLALRMGYAYSAVRTVNGFSAGIGFCFKVGEVNMALDYALRTQSWEESDFEVENLINLGARF